MEEILIIDPPSRLAHGGNGMLGPQKHPLRIHGQHAVPRRFGRVFQVDWLPTSTSPTHAGIIHQDIQRAITVDGRAHGLDSISLAGHIEMHVRRLAALLPYRLLHLLARLIEEITQHDFCPFPRKELGFSSALAAGATANQCHFSIRSSHSSGSPPDGRVKEVGTGTMTATPIAHDAQGSGCQSGKPPVGRPLLVYVVTRQGPGIMDSSHG